jgi:transposase
VKRQAVREYTYAYTALCPQNGDTVSLLLPAVNTDMMNLFLRELSAQLHQYRVILLLDQAGWHLSEKLETFDNIRILPFPAYSPELNPVENFWKYVRDLLGNGFWESMDALENRLVDILHDIKFQPDSIQSLTSYPWLFFPV